MRPANIVILSSLALSIAACGGGGGGLPNERAMRAGGADADAAITVATLPDGSSIVAGVFRGVATFGQGQPTETTLVSSGEGDLFVARYAAGGRLAWARRAGGLDRDAALGIATFADGSCIVAGGFSGDATFGEGEPAETTLRSAGGNDVFVARHEPDGRLAWARRAGGPDEEMSLRVATLANGSCVVAGRFSGDATFGEGEPAETTLVSSGDEDVFVARYASDGSLAWARRAGSAGEDSAVGIATLADESCVVAGRFFGDATFGEGEPAETTLVSSGGSDVFVARYAADGSLAWARSAGGPSFERAYGVAAFPDGSSVVLGIFEGDATFGLTEPGETTLTSVGPTDLFVARFHADGSLAWARQAWDVSSGEDIRGVAAFADGSCVVAGRFSDVGTFGPGEPNETTLSPFGSADMFVARYASDGSLAWATQAGGTESAGALGAAPLADGSCVVVGSFGGSATFGEGEPAETTLVSYGSDDIFVARFNADGGF